MPGLIAGVLLLNSTTTWFALTSLTAPGIPWFSKSRTSTRAETPEIQAQFEKEGAATRKMSSADFGKFIESEMKKWERVVKEGGIKAE